MEVFKMLPINFNKTDTAAMENSFDDTKELNFVGYANGYQEAIEKFHAESPNIVPINMTNDHEAGMTIIRDICAMTNKASRPLFVFALNTGTVEINVDPYTRELKHLGYFLPNYGEGQDVKDMIECIECMMDALRVM